MPRQPAVYILASKLRGTLYIGVTNDLVRRTWQHRTGAFDGFTKEHRVHRLVYVEPHQRMIDAIRREKQMKKWRRAWKVELIERENPEWVDLWPRIAGATAAKNGGEVRR